MSSDKTQTVVTDLASKTGFLKRLPVKVVLLAAVGTGLALATRRIQTQMLSSDEVIVEPKTEVVSEHTDES